MKTKNSLQLFWRLALVVIAAGLLGGLWAYMTGRLTAENTAAQYLTAKVARGNVERTVLATGILKPRSLVAVGAQVSGRVTALHVGLGDEVKEGDLVAEIDSVTQTNSLRTAEASLSKSKAQLVEKQASLVLAKQSEDRQKNLAGQNAGTMADLESAEADVKTVLAQIDALKAEIIEAEVAVETAKANLGYTRITAPVSGTVLAVVSQEGQTVNAVQSAPTIVILGDLDVMTVRAEISEADIVNVAPGQKVSFTIIGAPDRSYETTLESIEPAPESITSDSSITSSGSSSSSTSSSTSSSAIYYNGIFHVPNPNRVLRTYMTAEVTITLGSVEDVLTVPFAAVNGVGEELWVQVLSRDGSVGRRPVQTGLNDKVTTEILSGLEEGETVIIGEQLKTGTSTSSRRGPPMGL